MTDLLQGLSLYLVGMMGAGKSSIGPHLARALNYRFVDMDDVITTMADQSISEIFAHSGEAHFRQLETRVLDELSAYTRCVIATGGGIVVEPHNWRFLQQGFVVWLDAPLGLLLERLQGDRSRPLLQETDPTAKLQSILEQRQADYQKADLHCFIAPEQSPEAIAKQILEQIPSRLKPPRQPPPA